MNKSKKFAVVLSGCGVYDGSEIHEATLSMYAIAKSGCSYKIFAPDIEQHHVINHLTGKEMNETRNVLIESARIARGKIKPLSEFNPKDFDFLLFPGGFGAAKNLSNYAFKGADCSINEDVEGAIKSMVELKKPIGALCISPVLLGKLLDGVKLTIGEDEATIKELNKMGAKHKETTHGEIIIDEKFKIVTTPCYMLDATIDQIGKGSENIVKALLEME